MSAAAYLPRARAYAERVVDGREVAGQHERAACQRFLDDLARQASAGFPYRFDELAAARACTFIELLPHIKGEWAKPVYIDGALGYATLELGDWQLFIVLNIFGWRHVETGLRRFRRVYMEVARKNAKSTLAAGILLYLLVADGEPGAHVYSAATTGEQAREVFDVARNMALRAPAFVQRFAVTVGKHDITVEGTASSAKPLNAEGSTLDGLNVHGAIIDELHAHKTRAVYDVIDSATGARSQPLIMMITTAGSDQAGICYEQRIHTTKVLGGAVQDDTWFGVIYTLDEGDLWSDPAVWRKANPNLGVSVKVDDMQAACRKAQSTPSAQGNFLTKRLNIWVNAAAAWMSAQRWDPLGDPTLHLRDFAGEQCWIGMDLAEKKDFAALCLVFRRGADWYVFPRLYLNEAAVEESGNAQLKGWCDEGHVVITDGNATDLDVVAEDLRSYCRDFDVQEIPYDPARAMYFANLLFKEGLPLVTIKQAPTFFTQPLIQIENLVLEGRIHHDGNPAMAWMMSNVGVKVSRFSGLKHPVKDREEQKIDGPVAMLLGFGRAMLLVEGDEVFDMGEGLLTA